MGRKRWGLSIFAAVVLSVGMPSVGLGNEVKVEFSQGLTNGTGWMYGPKIFFNKSNEAAYIRAEEGGQVISPDFGFAVTSVVIVLKNTTVTENGRKTKFSPIEGGVVATNSVWAREVRASGEKEEEEKWRGRGSKDSRFERGVFENRRKAVILDKKKIVVDGKEINMV